MNHFLPGNFELKFSRYTGGDRSSVAWVFVGQGSAFPTMFKKEYEERQAVRDHFDIADRVAIANELPLPSAFVLGEIGGDPRKMPLVKNLALYAAQVGLAEALLSLGLSPDLTMAHSFGEYAALTTCGLLPFETGCQIVIERDRACGEPHLKGVMIAISGSETQVVSSLGAETFWVANRNSPEQTVVSVATNELETIVRRLKKQRLPFVVLKVVPQPYHSPLMVDASVSFRKIIEKLVAMTTTAKRAHLSSVDGRIIEIGQSYSRDEILKLLCDQLTEPVNFAAQITERYATGVHTFVSIDPGDTLDYFIRTSLKGRTFNSKKSTEYFETALTAEGQLTDLSQTIKSPWLKRLLTVITEVTGYQLHEIGLTSRFQDDLAIDSIKKAEILYRTLQKADVAPSGDVSISRFSRVHEVVDYLEEKSLESLGKVESEKVFNFRRMQPKWSSAPLLTRGHITAALQKTELRPFTVSQLLHEPLCFTEMLRQENELTAGHAVVIDARNETSLKVDAATIERYFEFLKDFNQSLLQAPPACGRFVILLCNERAGSFLAAMASSLKALVKETKRFQFKSIVCDSLEPLGKLPFLRDELADPTTFDVRYRGSDRQVLRFANSEIQEISARRLDVVLCIGGARGINLSLLENLASDFFGAHIYLIGRSPPSDDRVKSGIEHLKACGLNVKYEQTDACDSVAMSALVKRLAKEHGRIDLILNGAGYEVSEPLAQRNIREIVHEVQAKLKPALLLAELSHEVPIHKMIHYSSIVSHFGNDGQTAYCFANQALSNLDQEASKNTDVLVVNWPAWDRIGMTENLGIYQKLLEKGVSMIGAEAASSLLRDDLRSSSPGFASVFYIEPRDTYRMRYGLLAANADSSKIIYNEFSREFGAVLDVSKERYLYDHRVRNRFVAPLSLVTSLLCDLGRAYFMSTPAVLRFRFQTPLLLNESANDILLKIIYDPTLVSEVAATVSTSVQHAEAVLVDELPQPSSQKIDWVGFESFDPQEIYLFSRGVVDIDQSVQFFKKTYRNFSTLETISEIDLGEIRDLTRDSFYNLCFQMLEIGMQTTGSMGVLRERRTPLPQRFDSLRWGVFEKIPSLLNVYSKAVAQIDNGYVAEIRYIDPANDNVILTVLGMEYEYVD